MSHFRIENERIAVILWGSSQKICWPIRRAIEKDAGLSSYPLASLDGTQPVEID